MPPVIRRDTPERQLAGFIAKFAPDMASLIRALRRQMRQRLPHALELVYDNYNFFVIGYGPTDKASAAILSLAAYSKGVNLCFLQGAGLPDPKRLLRGSGSTVRSIKLDDASTLDQPDVQALVSVAIARAKVPFEPGGRHRLIIKSVSAKQRPRRSTTSLTGERRK